MLNAIPDFFRTFLIKRRYSRKRVLLQMQGGLQRLYVSQPNARANAWALWERDKTYKAFHGVGVRGWTAQYMLMRYGGRAIVFDLTVAPEGVCMISKDWGVYHWYFTNDVGSDGVNSVIHKLVAMMRECE